jgi:hypothetical protein
MPTNKHFPDDYFADRDGPVHWDRALIWVALVAVVGLSATGRLDTVWSRIVGSNSNQTAPAAPLQTPGTPGSSPAPSTPAAPQRRQQEDEQRSSILATGEPVPGSGRSPELQAFGLKSGIVVRSYSPMPVEITLSDGYGSAFTPLATLSSGQSASQSLVTGTRYGYCFTQGSGDGFLATRGCGTESWTQTVNGVTVPSGSPLTTSISFGMWQSAPG